MPEYKLYYFNLKALGEPIRFLLSYGNLPFEDLRYTHEEFKEIKPTMPMGQMPVLEVDGKKMHQSVAIARYLGRLVGLAGANDWENLAIDSVMDTINDFRIKLAAVSYEPDEEIKEKKRATLNKEVIPFYMEKLDTIVRDNKGYLANGKLSWVDLYFVAVLDCLNYISKLDLVADRPNLKRLVDTVTSIKSIKQWISKRPQSDL